MGCTASARGHPGVVDISQGPSKQLETDKKSTNDTANDTTSHQDLKNGEVAKPTKEPIKQGEHNYDHLDGQSSLDKENVVEEPKAKTQDAPQDEVKETGKSEDDKPKEDCQVERIEDKRECNENKDVEKQVNQEKQEDVEDCAAGNDEITTASESVTKIASVDTPIEETAETTIEDVNVSDTTGDDEHQPDSSTAPIKDTTEQTEASSDTIDTKEAMTSLPEASENSEPPADSQEAATEKVESEKEK